MTLDCYDGSDPGKPAPADPRPYVGILFECCGVYARIYRRPDRMVYQGRCPRCLRPVRLRVGQDGIDARLFRAH